MPDWTYQPLRRPIGLLLGQRKSLRLALSLISLVARLPGGAVVVAGLGHTRLPAPARRQVAGFDCPSPVGASIGVNAAGDSLRALPPLGAGLIEVGPVHQDQVAKLKATLRSRKFPVLLRVAGVDAFASASELAPFVSAVVLDIEPPGEEAVAKLSAAVGKPVLAGIRNRYVGPAPAGVGLVLRRVARKTCAR